MIGLSVPSERVTGSILGRTSPLVKIGVAAIWLIGLVTTLDPRPPLFLAGVAIAATVGLGRVAPLVVVRALAPLLVAAFVIAFFNLAFAASNADPAARELARVGPLRVTHPAASAALALGLRVVAIAATSVAFATTTSATHLVDALVQQARVSDRFAYGALAAYQTVPALSDDLLALRQARRIRGLATSWHPRVLIGLLALAVRRADRQALAMDARGFGSPNRTYFREVQWTVLDAAVAAAGVVLLALALLLTMT